MRHDLPQVPPGAGCPAWLGPASPDTFMWLGCTSGACNQKFESAPRYRRNHPPYWPHRRQALNLAGAPFGGHQWGLVKPAQLCWEPLARAETVVRNKLPD